MLRYLLKYPQLILTTVGRLTPVSTSGVFVLCHSFIISKQSEIGIPEFGSDDPCSPATLIEYIFEFFAQPYVLPAAIPATCVPCPS